MQYPSLICTCCSHVGVRNSIVSIQHKDSYWHTGIFCPGPTLDLNLWSTSIWLDKTCEFTHSTKPCIILVKYLKWLENIGGHLMCITCIKQNTHMSQSLFIYSCNISLLHSSYWTAEDVSHGQWIQSTHHIPTKFLWPSTREIFTRLNVMNMGHLHANTICINITMKHFLSVHRLFCWICGLSPTGLHFVDLVQIWFWTVNSVGHGPDLHLHTPSISLGIVHIIVVLK